eukprot:gene31766-38395_t
MALNFPAKIYQILENESSDIIRWHGNGAAFRIVDHGRFEREIIPKYFRHNQLSSVQRQLNLYGFKCISRGEDKGAFFHPKFRKGDWEIVKRITRYTPTVKKPDSPSPDKKDDTVILLSENQTMDTSISLASSADAIANEHYQNALNVGFSQFGSTMHPFPTFDFFSHDPSQTHMYQNAHSNAQWHWPIMHPTPIYNYHHMYGQNVINHPVPAHSASSSSSVQSVPKQSSSDVGMGSSLVEMEVVKAGDTTATSSSSSSSPATEVSPPAPSLASADNKEDKGFINVVNSVVTVDPYFDFGEEFDLFAGDNDFQPPFTAVVMPEHKLDVPPEIPADCQPAANGNPKMVDMGVNTILTMCHPSIAQLNATLFEMN